MTGGMRVRGRLLRGGTAVVLIGAAMLLADAAPAQTKHVGWSGKPPPKGVTADTYSPGTPPNFPDGFKSPAGTGDDYDPRLDPTHPLKNPLQDPGEKWEGSHGSNLNTTFVGTGKGDIDWGEQYYEGQFVQLIKVNNECRVAQPVGIFVYDLPYLTMPPVHMAPPGESTVQGQVKLPPEPPPPLRTGLPGEPGWGHVDFGTIIIPPGMFPPPVLHQPNFAKVDGKVVLWHPWTGDCNGVRITYTVTGHIHFRPPPPDGKGGPEKIASPDVCTVWWNTGEEPAQRKDEDCTEKFRELATRFIQAILAPYISNAPEKWDWLPTVAELGVMSASEMLTMKAVAEGVLGHDPAANPPKPPGWTPGPEARADNAGATGTISRPSGSGTGNPPGSAHREAGQPGEIR